MRIDIIKLNIYLRSSAFICSFFKNYSAFTPVSLMTFAHLAISDVM